MIDHIGIGASDYARSRHFYDEALRPLGVTALVEITPSPANPYHGTGYGRDGRAFFWLGSDGPRGTGIHIAFAAPDRAAVDAFHAAALAAGGHDNGAPGLRPHYHPDYYGAFVLDPDGLNIEAVCRTPE
ncbi:MAG: glyoxalase/bleomycin resistance/extradiol dioxygenase family protein [Azospirillum brasilense]|uniref:VOC family protein n=1 Tax=Roseomonas gilardii TaxID=257708 RepID=UPI000DB72745|nr:VOC family protein [Roseomonas gilardii]PZP43471.1 MAG: glyoxalase/bleomycin resistance/extradiol dioxygenase family protein [Azospirillum brasilense]